MSAPSLVLYALDHHLSPRDFERLCVDLLGRDGYWRIEPIGGTNDHGRDAEAVYWRGKSAHRAVVVFQFSLQEDWERKMREDADKIAAHCPAVEAMVFVTSRTVTGAKQDKLAAEFEGDRGWVLTIHSREWLRLRLEEFHPDLARKYLAVDLPDTVCSIASQIENFALDGPSAKELFRDKSPDQVRASIIGSTRKEPGVAAHWKRLAKIECYLDNFRAALDAVNRGFELDPTDINLRLLKGAILAELGIETESTPLLIQAKEIFAYAVAKVHRPVDHFNLANVLTPLGELDEAEAHYLRSLELRPYYAQCWKNLGTLYSKKGEHQKSMECFDKALEIEPALVEAHLSRANTWLLFFGQPEKALVSFQTAYALEADLDRRWRHGRYWYSHALALAGQYEAALQQTEIGLRGHPDELSLLNQKAGILSHLWPEQEKFVGPAYEFFTFRAQCVHHDYEGLVELIKLSAKRGDAAGAWPLVESNLACKPYSLQTLLASAGLTIAELRIGLETGRLFERFRECSRVTDHGFTLHRYGLSPNPAMVPALHFCVLASFGLMDRRFCDWAKTPEVPISSEAFDTLLDQLSHIFAAFGADWLAVERPAAREEQIKLLSLGMLYLSDVVVAEAARIVGYLGVRYEVKVEEWVDRKHAWNEFSAEAGVRLMACVLNQWQMLPLETTGDAP